MEKVEIGTLLLENGETIPHAELAYERRGPMDAPIILVCHALTGSQYTVGTSEEPGWWDGLIGPGKYIDTNQYQVITFNVLGSCYGSTGPQSINPETSRPYRMDFPFITIRDMVHAQKRALLALGVNRVKAVIGGSLGGMQVLEWGLLYPNDMDQLLLFASTPYYSDYGIAFNEIGITAIENDPGWKNGYYQSSEDVKGLEIARMVGMVSYRSAPLFESRFNRKIAEDNHNKFSSYEVSSYMRYQGKKLTERFDANSYLYLLRAMNSHDIGKGRGGWKKAASQYKAKLIAFGFQHDLIFRPEDIEAFAREVPDSEYHFVPTKFGHDGFLVEFENWGHIVREALQEESKIRVWG
ncbi:homoserine O-acetyltransferase MetX [Heyndrickxia ginsengihumi]|uniref:homoserine O-acetyltransferase MetX n=1 Tax=Heyndrickxia ginsengihumi TaxID=363870 RepID=UPI00046F2379|nr:homoserine O-acetyltransferase [Heyndrickxia ginsengihumi]MCM3023369.1 homoserine O-acetyltransferase [Heyndrickxia ginsengihumi]